MIEISETFEGLICPEKIIFHGSSKLLNIVVDKVQGPFKMVSGKLSSLFNFKGLKLFLRLVG